jgi:hypothetical protein
LSILEWARHELRIAHGLTLMTPSLRGWEAFPTPGALTHTRITWALSPPAPQVPGVTPGSPLCPWCFGHPFGEVRDTHPHQTESMPSSTILVVGTPILELPSSMVRHCVYLRARPPQCIYKFGIVPKVSVLGGPLATLNLSSKDLTYIGPTYFGTHLGCPSFGASPVRLHEPNLTHLGRTSTLPLSCLGCNSEMTFHC